MTARRRLSPEQRRDELLDAAATLLRSSRPEQLSLEQVAESAGCSRNLAYNYFPNREALVDALRQREQATVAAELAAIPHDASFDDWIVAVADTILRIAASRGQLLVLLFEPERVMARTRRRMFLLDVVGSKLEAAGVAPERCLVVSNLLGGALMAGAGAVVNRGASPADVAAEFVAIARQVVAAGPPSAS